MHSVCPGPFNYQSLSEARYSLIESIPNRPWHTIHFPSTDRDPHPANAKKTIHLYNSCDMIKAPVVQDYGFLHTAVRFGLKEQGYIILIPILQLCFEITTSIRAALWEFSVH